MIISYVEFFLLLASGLLWYVLSEYLDDLLTRMQTQYTTYYPAADIAFIQSIDHWILFVIVFGGVWYLLVAAQRTRPEGYYA